MRITDKISITNESNIELMARYPDKYFDLAIIDIEYGLGYSSPTIKPNKVIQKNGSVLNVKQPNYLNKNWDNKKSTDKYFEQLFRVSKNQIVFGGNYYGLEGGYLVWDKLNGESDQFGCELAWLSFTNRTDIVYYLYSGMFQGKEPSNKIEKALIQEGNKKNNEIRIHPTQKPVKLYKWLLKNYAKKGDKILDTHLGSASIAIACYDFGFELVGCEIDVDYYEDSLKRVKEYISNKHSLFNPEELLNLKS